MHYTRHRYYVYMQLSCIIHNKRYEISGGGVWGAPSPETVKMINKKLFFDQQLHNAQVLPAPNAQNEDEIKGKRTVPPSLGAQSKTIDCYSK